MQPKKKKEKRGGKRPNSGRKKVDYKTIVLSFRVKEEMAEAVKKIVKEYINNHSK